MNGKTINAANVSSIFEIPNKCVLNCVININTLKCSTELRERIARINRENKTKKQQKKITEIENKHLPKLEE
jgi:hypothetical protein